jgi:hypothetical protein
MIASDRCGFDQTFEAAATMGAVEFSGMLSTPTHALSAHVFAAPAATDTEEKDEKFRDAERSATDCCADHSSLELSGHSEIWGVHPEGISLARWTLVDPSFADVPVGQKLAERHDIECPDGYGKTGCTLPMVRSNDTAAPCTEPADGGKREPCNGLETRPWGGGVREEYPGNPEVPFSSLRSESRNSFDFVTIVRIVYSVEIPKGRLIPRSHPPTTHRRVIRKWNTELFYSSSQLPGCVSQV